MCPHAVRSATVMGDPSRCPPSPRCLYGKTRPLCERRTGSELQDVLHDARREAPCLVVLLVGEVKDGPCETQQMEDGARESGSTGHWGDHGGGLEDRAWKVGCLFAALRLPVCSTRSTPCCLADKVIETYPVPQTYALCYAPPYGTSWRQEIWSQAWLKAHSGSPTRCEDDQIVWGHSRRDVPAGDRAARLTGCQGSRNTGCWAAGGETREELSQDNAKMMRKGSPARRGRTQ